MTKAERAHLSKVASLGCICPLPDRFGLVRCEAPAEIHHVLNGTMGRKASNFETIPLCPYHHRLGPFGHAVHDGTKSFEARYGKQAELLNSTLSALGITETT
ncbi:Ref family recombination enhancement nuclease [Bradyrhizobium sp. 14AA]